MIKNNGRPIVAIKRSGINAIKVMRNDSRYFPVAHPEKITIKINNITNKDMKACVGNSGNPADYRRVGVGNENMVDGNGAALFPGDSTNQELFINTGEYSFTGNYIYDNMKGELWVAYFYTYFDILLIKWNGESEINIRA